MFIGAHVLLYSADPEADRKFFAEVLGFRSVDVGGGWLIFKLPPAEAAIHPMDAAVNRNHVGEKLAAAVLYLMCDDVKGLASSLKSRGIACTAIETERWGMRTTIPLPSGAQIGLYQPTHPTALAL